MATTMTGTNKASAVTLNPMTKAGSGWDYDDPEITYDGEFDPHGRRVLYDSVGTAPSMAGQVKSSAITLNPQNKS